MGEWIDLQSDPSLIDSELSLEGIEQCKFAAGKFSHKKFDVVFISPMKRCLQTAHNLFS